MSKFTNEQINNLQERAKKIAQGIDDGKATADIMAQLYVDAFEGKTLEQGKLIADTIIKAVKDFDIDYAEAKVDVDHFIHKFQKKIDKNKSCYERCQFWRDFALAVTASTIASNDMDNNMEEIVKELGKISLSEENANDYYEEKLRQLAFDAIKSSNIMTEALAIHSEELEAIDNADEAAQLLIDLGNEDVDYRSIVAMLAYIDTLNGEYPEIPVDMTAVQIAGIVCTEIEQIKIIDALENGDLTLTSANEMLYILGIVAIAQVAVAAAVVAISVAASCFSSILVIPAGLVMVAGIIHLTCKGIRMWEKDSQKIMTTVIKSIRKVINGGRKLFNYMKDVMIPGLIDKCKQRLNEIKNKKTQSETEAVTQTALTETV